MHNFYHMPFWSISTYYPQSSQILHLLGFRIKLDWTVSSDKTYNHEKHNTLCQNTGKILQVSPLHLHQHRPQGMAAADVDALLAKLMSSCAARDAANLI